MPSELETRVREALYKQNPNSTLKLHFWTPEELDTKLKELSKEAETLGVTYEQLKDGDWDGTLTTEEYNLFGRWKKFRHLAGVDR